MSRVLALHRVPGLLVAGLISLGGTGLAQEVEAPAAPGADGGSGSVFAPSGWLGLIVPVHDRVSLRPYGFYIGRLNTPVAQVDVAVRTTRFLTITPSYMYYAVPASGLDRIATRPGGFTDTYEEHQFRLDGTVFFSVRSLEISVRNMYVRRFRPSPADDIDRYRGRIMLAHPLTVDDHIWKPFAAYETYNDARGVGGIEIESGLASRYHSRAAWYYSHPICGKPVKDSRTSTTCCLA